ncbi:hypothetical protein ACOSP7_027599 [Xanthoceras sorbifolium]
MACEGTSESSPNQVMTPNQVITPTSQQSSFKTDIISFNATVQLPLKLSGTNFSSWKVQIETLLFGYGCSHQVSHDGLSYAIPSSLCFVSENIGCCLVIS